MARPREACRPFTVLDALVMIAALAVGLAWARFRQASEHHAESYPHWTEAGPPGLHAALVVAWWVDLLAYAVIAATIAVFGLSLRRPRPGLRRLARRPGAVAGGGVCLAVAMQAVEAAVETFIAFRFGGLAGRGVGIGSHFLHNFTVSLGDLSLAVAVAWGLLALSGRWRREAGWLDRCGLVLGVFWIVVPPLVWSARLLSFALDLLS